MASLTQNTLQIISHLALTAKTVEKKPIIFKMAAEKNGRPARNCEWKLSSIFQYFWQRERGRCDYNMILANLTLNYQYFAY